MANVSGKAARKKKPLLVIAIVVIVFMGLAAAGVLYLCNLFYTIDNPEIARSPYYEYIVKIHGFEDDYAPGGNATIMVPVPACGGSPVLPFKGALDKGFGNYGQGYSPYDCTIVDTNPFGYHGTRPIEAVNTSHGLMLAARINYTDSREVDFHTVPKPVQSFDRIEIRIQDVIGPAGDRATSATLERMEFRPLYPDAGALPTGFTVPMPGANVTGYTSYVYIDEGLKSGQANSTIDIYCSLVIRVNYHPYGPPLGENYLFFINESIPGNVTGFVPVKVQCMGRVNSSELYDYMEGFYAWK